MPENRPGPCGAFEEWLCEATGGDEPTSWREHLAVCPDCRRQWLAHRLLAASLAADTVPELPPSFDADLERRLRAELAVRPLGAWRTLVLGGYAAAAAALMSWVLDKYPLPEVSIDPSSLWLRAAALAAVPLTLILCAVASRWLPPPKGDVSSIPGSSVGRPPHAGAAGARPPRKWGASLGERQPREDGSASYSARAFSSTGRSGSASR